MKHVNCCVHLRTDAPRSEEDAEVRAIHATVEVQVGGVGTECGMAREEIVGIKVSVAVEITEGSRAVNEGTAG